MTEKNMHWHYETLIPVVEVAGWRPESDLYPLAATFVHLWGGIPPRTRSGHQERVALFLLKEFDGKPKAKARQRTAVVEGALALTNVRANKSLRAAANAAISALIGKDVVVKPGRRSGPVRPTLEFLESWVSCHRQTQEQHTA